MRRVFDPRLLVPLGLAALFLCFPSRSAAGAASGLRLAAELLIPSLFPVGVLSGCLLRMGPERAAERLAGRAVRRCFGVSGAGALPLVLGLLGGYPLGTLLVCSMYREGRLSGEDARRLSGLCNHAGPAFLLGVAGTVLGALRLGAALIGVQLLSALLTGLLLRRPPAGGQAAPPPPSGQRGFLDALLQSIRETALSMVALTGTLCFFHAGLACLEGLLPLSALPPALRACITGFLELSGGISALAGLSARTSFSLAALLVGWGGCCVHLQAASALRSAGLPVAPYLRAKLLHGALCLLLAAGFLFASRLLGNSALSFLFLTQS